MYTKLPGPGNYSPKTNLNENVTSPMRSFGRTKFGKDERKAMEYMLYKNIETPGPGQYA